MPERDPIHAEARRLVGAGLSIIPIKRDGSKAPALPWKAYQSRLPTEAELCDWFGHPGYGLAIVGGAISGHLEILDFDASDLFAPWADLVEDLSPGLLQRLPVVHTPSDGRHLYYRCPRIEGNQKLAQQRNAEGRPETAIETRGEGGYVLAPGCSLACHPLGKPYVLLDGDLADIPTITSEERHLLHQAARTFHTYVEPTRVVAGQASPASASLQGARPGDAFNAQAAWSDILAPQGWTRVGQHGQVTLWIRPGKRERGISATTNYAGSELLYVFSTNASPFEPETAYSKFAAYALLHHRGDFTAAAKRLADAGYGDRNSFTAGDNQRPPVRSWRSQRRQWSQTRVEVDL